LGGGNFGKRQTVGKRGKEGEDMDQEEGVKVGPDSAQIKFITHKPWREHIKMLGKVAPGKGFPCGKEKGDL